MKKSIFKGKSTRTKIFSVITLVGIVLLFVLNLGFTYISGQKLLVADITPEGFYTLSDKMLEVCNEMLGPDENGNVKKIKITFCTDPDYLVESDAMRATYFMALTLQNKFDNVEVKTVNVALNPTAVSMYKTTSRDQIKASDVIFSYGSKFRITDATTFWIGDNFSYNGEYRVASIIASLLAIDRPVAYFTTDHGETYYDPENPESDKSIATTYLADLLSERGLEIKTLNLSDPNLKEIPDDCALLIINDPREDFAFDEDQLDRFDYVSAIEKIDRYLYKEASAVIINKAPDVYLPYLENFCKEWGIGFGNEQIYDPDNALFTVDGKTDDSLFAGVYDPDEANFGYAYYGSYTKISSSPKMVFSNAGSIYCTMNLSETMVEPGNKFSSINYAPFIGTSSNAYYDIGGPTNRGVKTLIAASVRSQLNDYTNEYQRSYLFCMSSADFFSNDLLSNVSYANYDILASIVSNISRTDRYATIELGGLSFNSSSYGGKQSTSTTLSDTPTKVYSWDAKEILKYNKGLSTTAITIYTIMVMAVPVAAATLGIIVFIKRKYL